MFCKKGVFVNWGNIPNLEMEFGPVNLFSGGNGSGKTTAADGLQSLMTAAHENLFTYNPGQDETTQKGRGGKQVRTLASYVLGCDDGSYSRPRPTDGYVAGVFHPTEGEGGDVFSAVMCIRASLDKAGASRQARQDELLFLIIPHEEVNLAHFVKQDKDEKFVVPITEVSHYFQKQYGLDGVEVYDKKGPYLRRLYGALRGQKGAISDREAKHAARTFSNFMAYKPVKSINDFVAKEVLDPKDLSEDIRQVSELMKTIHSMEEETRHVKDAISNLSRVDELASAYLTAWVDRSTNEFKETTRLLGGKQQEYLKAKNDQRQNQQCIEETEHQLSNNDNKKKSLHDQLVALEAKRQGIRELNNKDQLEKSIELLKGQLAEQAKPLLAQNHQFSENFKNVLSLQKKLKQFSIAVDIPSFEQKGFSQAINQLVEGGQDSGIDAHKLLNDDWVGINDLESRLEGLIEFETKHRNIAEMLHDSECNMEKISIRDQLLNVVNHRKEQQEKIKQQLSMKRLEIQRLENHTVVYPAYVEQAISAINAKCPQAKPNVLCDFIEITEPHWQMAIEGYLGGNRFSILVEEDYEAEAIRIIRKIKGRKNNARVIQGAKVQRDASRINLPSGSILEVMEFEHKIVEYYLQATYGNVVRVDGEEQLKGVSRGISANGVGAGNYSLFRCDVNEADLVFGQGARDRALHAKQQQLLTIDELSKQSEEDHRQAAFTAENIENIKTVHCANIIKTMLELYRDLQHAENQLSNLDLADFKQLEESLSALKADFDLAEQEGKQLERSAGEFHNTLKHFNRSIDKLSNEKDALEDQRDVSETAVSEIAKIYPGYDYQSALQQAEQQAKKVGHDFSFDEQIHQNLIQLDQNERALHDAILHHNQTSNAYNSIMYITASGERNDSGFFKSILSVQKQAASVYNSMKNNVLVGKHEKISALKDSFNTAFITNLCHSIYQSINDGKRILDELNKELEHHRFGSDQERFYFDYQWVPEFYEYQRFFKEVIDSPSLGEGNTLFEAELSKKSCIVRDRLLSMLLDKDEQTAMRELKRISDYRNYREYEIYKEPFNKQPIALSKYGTGSGGQLETPAYIIRSAAVTSAFRFNEGSTHCRMVLVDEAFSKMDETRSKEVISYLTKTLGLQLIFIMPTSKSGPFMDLISNQTVFSKCPTSEQVGELRTRVLVDRKSCNQDKIKQLWANHRKTVRHQGMLEFMEEFV